MGEHIVDITIIGGGPTGLAAAYYGAHRDASVRIVESLEQLGGQVAAVYPEKHIFDVAGYPKVNGQELIDRLTEQAMQYEPEVRLGEVIESITHRDDEVIELHTEAGETLLTRTIIITAGHGAFNPRKLDLPDLESWEGNGLHYFVKKKDVFAGKRVALVGGGDSALDWAMGLQDTAALPISLIHRRERFRGLESSYNEVCRLAEGGGVEILVPCEVRRGHRERAARGDHRREHGDGRDARGAVRRAGDAARLRVPPRPDRELGPRVREQAPDPGEPDRRDEPAGRLRSR